MARTLTYNKPNITLAVSSLKGNTIGILEKIDSSKIDNAIRIKRQPEEEIKSTIEGSDVLILGVSTYSSKFKTKAEYPAQLRRYKEVLEGLSDKNIILFGSGRSEYPLFCGALDYLENMLKEKNNVLLKYKFEGYPKGVEKEEFKNKLECILDEVTEVREKGMRTM